MQVLEQILQEIEKESDLACEEMRRCVTESPLQFYEVKGYVRAMENALAVIRSHIEDEPVSNTDRLDDGWIPAKTPPERNMRVQALIKHHKWIADYDSDWVPEEEKTVHPERMEICEAIYKNGEFSFRIMEDDEFAETAYISPKENLAAPVCEILLWRPVECAQDNWIPAEYPPETDTYILLSFSNFSLPLIGRYEEDGDGGAFYLGDCDGNDTCIGNNLYVNAWQPIPIPYQFKED